MESLKRMAGTLLAIVQTRLELLSNEFEEERLRVSLMLLYGCVALFFIGLSIMLLTVIFVLCFWDSHPLLVLGSFAVLYFIAGLIALKALSRMAQERSKLFSTSLSELSDDLERLEPRP